MGLCFIPYRGAVILYMSKETRMLNPSAVLYGPHDVRIEDRPVPEPAPGQVLVEIAAVGICGSDVHYYEHGRIGDYVVRDPMIIGHESVGTVVDVVTASTETGSASRLHLSRAYRAERARNACGAATTFARGSSSSPRRLWTARSAITWPLTPPSPIPPCRG